MIVSKFFGSKSIRNSLWMMSEKLISIFGLIFVMSLVAKYIGPTNFGKLTFTSSIFFIIQILAMFGLDGIIFQKTSRNREQGEKIIAVTRIVRDLIYVPASVIILLYLYLSTDDLTFVYAVCTSIGTYFLLHDVYSIYFNALLLSYINVICNSIGLILALIARYLIVEFKVDIVWLGLPIIIVSIVPYFIKVFIYKSKRSNLDFTKKQKKKYNSAIFSIGKKMVVYSVSVAIFLKTSQIILGYFSQHDLGIYTVSVTLGTSYYFVLVAIITSFMPEIYNEKDIKRESFLVARLNLIVILISLSALLFFGLFGKWIVFKLYGDEYSLAFYITILMIIVCMFSGLSTVVDKFLLKYNSYDFLMKKTNILMFINIILSFVTIYYYGIFGALFSILFTEFMSATLMNYFFKKVSFWEIHRLLFNIEFYKTILRN